MKISQLIKEGAIDHRKGIELVNDALGNLDPNLNYEDFAKIIGGFILDEYGTHNVQGIMEILHQVLNYTQEKQLAEEIEYDGDGSIDSVLQHLQQLDPNITFEIDYQRDFIKGYSRDEQETANFLDKYEGRLVGTYRISSIDKEGRKLAIKAVNTAKKPF